MRKFDHEDFFFIIRRTGRQHQLKNQYHVNEQNKARLEMFEVLNFHGLKHGSQGYIYGTATLSAGLSLSIPATRSRMAA
ncbi:MAG: hypothetical protein IIB78_06700 [Proteobacteria bacterium]|nr:hypothetical protein [Pseudomonadota bacterium]